MRPTWGGGRVRATTLELEPLPPEESAELVEALAAELELPIDVEAVLAKTEGNPLFVEETVRMLAERPRGGTERIPDTLQALIAARIDRLPRVAARRAPARVRDGPGLHGAARSRTSRPRSRTSTARSTSCCSATSSCREERSTITRRAGVQVQARADPRGRVRGALEGVARRPAPRVRGVARRARRRRAARDPRLPPRPGGAAARRARRRRAARSSPRRRQRRSTKAGRRALSRESFRSARKLLLRAVELAPTLERRYFAGRAAWRLGDFPAVHRRDGGGRGGAPSAPARRRLQGRALTALAEAVLQHRADAVDARALVEQAVEVLADEEPEIRFEALRVASQVAAWLGDDEEFEHWAKLALAAAREAERKDLEALAIHGLVDAYIIRLELAEAEPLVERALELAEESGSLFGRAIALERGAGSSSSASARRGRGRLHGRARALRGARQHDRARPR